jgi:hypothetical protein
LFIFIGYLMEKIVGIDFEVNEIKS